MSNAQAIVLTEHGGPEQLRLQDVDVGTPGPGQLLVRQTAVGVNFHDIYIRTGLYRMLALPGIPGIEGAGIVEAVGPGVSGFKPGDRIGYVSPEYGSYASRRLLPAFRAAVLPDGLSEVDAAGSLMKALTVCMMVRHVHRISEGQTVLVHAAAGGVGQLLCSWARALGARVIGTVGSEEKAAVARQAGASDVIQYGKEDFVARVMDITGGRGVDAVYDSVGQDTFLRSIKCLDYGGKLVNFGQSSGAVDPFPPSVLAEKSTSVSRPIIFHFLRTAEAMQAMSGEVFDAIARGMIAPPAMATFPLGQAGEAHRMLEGRRSPGGVVLTC